MKGEREEVGREEMNDEREEVESQGGGDGCGESVVERDEVKDKRVEEGERKGEREEVEE